MTIAYNCRTGAADFDNSAEKVPKISRGAPGSGETRVSDPATGATFPTTLATATLRLGGEIDLGSGGALGLMHPYLFEALDPEVLPDIKNGSTVDDPQYRWKLNGSDIASRFTPVYATTKQDPRVGKRRFSLGGRGGAGGGAIELVAVNDLEIGEFCHIRVDAAPGHESNNAGGGGGSMRNWHQGCERDLRRGTGCICSAIP